MAWTKQHFELVANVIREVDDLLQDSEREVLAERFADEFEAANERFDRNLFFDACGTPEAL